MTTITERVAAGAAFLDEHDPDWWKAGVERAIDLDSLDLAETSRCVLGQRCPLEVLSSYIGHPVEWLDDHDRDHGYDAYLRYLCKLPSSFERLDWAAARGFITEDDEDEADSWDDLTAEWRRVIAERRSA
jgi:hypothetical protein